jgi:plasmid stabilization system protein ParE
VIARIHHLAQMELDEATEWYQHESVPAAQRFIRAFRSAVTDIAKMPERFRRALFDDRQATIKRFPYCIIFAA